MKLLEAIKPAIELLEKAGIEDPFADAEILAFHAAGIDRLTAFTGNPEVNEETHARINEMLQRRAAGEPLQYIIGEVDFLELRIRVGRGVLIPRPETELLAQEAIEKVQRSTFSVLGLKEKQNLNAEQFNILDLCSGSGCISLALARAFPEAAVYGTDISAAAVSYARQNAVSNGIRNASFLQGSLFEPLEKTLLFDLIASNPPYIRKADLQTLQKEIRDWEPVEALDGGNDGLDFYRRIFADAERHLKKNGSVMLEVGFDQAGSVKEIAENSGFRKITIKKDFAGIERILTAEK